MVEVVGMNEWNQIVAKCWADEEFKQRFMADPAAVFAEYGVPVPEGIQLKVAENTAQVFNIAIPAKPSSEELSDEELGQASGGLGTYSLLCCSCTQ